MLVELENQLLVVGWIPKRADSLNRGTPPRLSPLFLISKPLPPFGC